MSEWIEHDGKGAPDLPPGTLVQVRFRDGLTVEKHPGLKDVGTVGYWGENWIDGGYRADIVAYRVVRDEQ